MTDLVRKFADEKSKTATWKEAEELCGKAGRLAQVIPDARPFCAGFYAALAGAKTAKRAQMREAPPTQSSNKEIQNVSNVGAEIVARKS